MKRELLACPRCGSDDLRMPGIRDGAVVGYGQEMASYTCRRCELTAVPLIFDQESGRKAFEAEQRKHPSKDWPAGGWPSTRL
ncbi:MAG: hypothetical protein AABY18_00185 [Candidatus Thermoplasmatota archaeon]